MDSEAQQVQAMVQQMQNNNLVQLKLIEYMEADIDAKDQEIAKLRAEVEALQSQVADADSQD